MAVCIDLLKWRMTGMYVKYLSKLLPLWRENAAIAWNAVKSNRLRSFLTILIISTGITSLVGTLTATEALKREVFASFEEMGSASFTVTARKLPSRQAVRGARIRNSRAIQYQQAVAFKERFSSFGDVSVFALLGNMPVKYSNRNLANPLISVVAADEDYLRYKGVALSSGRPLAKADVNSAAFVCIAGHDIVKPLFKSENPLGKYITVAGIRYEVVGVMEKTGNSFGGSADNEIIIPVSNARSCFISNTASFNMGVVPNSSADGIHNEFLYDRAEALFRSVRRLSPGDETDFAINRSDAILKELEEITGIITLSAAIIGLITLLGAAVALMNIMLVSVKERTREIGIRKAVGASSERIKWQFLVESALISQTGCMVGVVLGVLAGNAIAVLLGASFIIPWLWILFAVMICFLVGIASGYMPAKRASLLNPIDALRYE